MTGPWPPLRRPPIDPAPPRTWQGETTVALVCVPLYPCWLWVTEGNSNGFWFAVAATVVGVGVGTGLSGVRRGTLLSRGVAGLCLLAHLSAAAALILISVTAGR